MMKDLDKVYEAYMSEDNSELSVKTKERIHWICSQSKGENILDIGCSQGIISILLGRNNKRVLALDVVQESIDFANEKLNEEEEEVQKMVSFVCGDFYSYDLNGEKFDTVILTEVLEHIVDVESFVDKVQNCITDSGRVVITVPFGINDYWDHKRTYYLGNLYAHLEPLFDIVEIKFFGKWLGVICTKKGKSENKIIIDKIIMEIEEEAFYKIERDLVDNNKKYKKYIKTQKDKIESLKEREKELKNKIESLREREKELKNKIESLREREKELKNKVEERSEKVRQLMQKHKDLKDKLIEINKKNKE